MSAQARQHLARIQGYPLPGPVRIMNVCGGQERIVLQAGLRSLLPEALQLIPGPGCPVCICPEQDIHHAMELALSQSLTVLAFGDMLHVPVNAPRAQLRSLAQARARGADIRPIASPQQALAMARAEPQRPFCFFAAGFETTMAPIAAMVAQGLPDNLSLLISGRLTWPAVAALLQYDDHALDALIAPGHVAAVMGPEQWAFIADQHHRPVAVAGFNAESLLAAIDHCLEQILSSQQPRLINDYPEVVYPGGNPTAQRLLDQVFEIVDAPWRGIGTLPASGYRLRDAYQAHDARQRWPVNAQASDHDSAMPPGCRCADVVLGRIPPTKCPLFATTCTPAQPVGPCMVSDEGACRLWQQQQVIFL